MESLRTNLYSFCIFYDIEGAIKQIPEEFKVMCMQRAMQSLTAYDYKEAYTGNHLY